MSAEKIEAEKYFEIIHDEVSKGRQYMSLKRIVKHGDHCLRFTIKSDTYDFQSYAKVARFNGEKWEDVHSIHHSKMATPVGLVYSAGKITGPSMRSKFATDVEKLFKVAKAVLG